MTKQEQPDHNSGMPEQEQSFVDGFVERLDAREAEGSLDKDAKTVYEYIRVGAHELQSPKFLNLESETISGWEAKGYRLDSREPSAEIHADEATGQALLTFVYIFHKKTEHS
jgi:hypothetical protein